MMHRTLIHAEQLPDSLRATLLQLSAGDFLPATGHWRFLHHYPLDAAPVQDLREQYSTDINTLPGGFDPASVGLVVSDMDSTFIAIECIDEIADCLDIRPQVASITEKAMSGELDFAEALTRRVRLLKGIRPGLLQQVYDERLSLSPGAGRLLQVLRQRQIPFALVSGGFDFFTDRLQQEYGLDYTHANRLVVENGVITGELKGDFVDAAAKAAFLERLCRQLGLDSARQCIAVGDGANDLEMLAAAGLSVAFHGKPAVRKAADIVLDYSDLNAITHLLAC